ncbi:FAD-binding monooxygenase [Luteimicrobium sp. NPDC057192]|uniref:FAD-binding monooxygenase n=1 Tax=Luteimicrobium sp. NPDC057192 TaxID=3346042 RepID=UPI00362AE07C
MQFHHHGYVTGDPRVLPAAGTGLDRPEDLPDEIDVLVVGAGPAGAILTAQLGMYPGVTTRLVERRPGRLQIGQADGIQARSNETFQAFGFANRIIEEAFQLRAMNFWAVTPDHPDGIVRTQRTVDDPDHVSEFPHMIVNQARVLDYFQEYAAHSPARITPDYGWELVGLEVAGDGAYPVTVRLRRSVAATVGAHAYAEGDERVVHAKYVVGCDGAHSTVRASIGRRLEGDDAMHAWAVMDALTVTDFPDIRTKCAIQSPHGSILLIPREGGYLYRMYVDLGETDESNRGTVRRTTMEAAVERANAIMHPYHLDVRHIAWSSVYEVAHRLTDKFDDVPAELTGTRTPRVFIAGDACHTHSAKAGQGMNVSMQDGWNLAWKLGQVLTGLSPESLLDTYSGERWQIAKDLIEFDGEWSTLMTRSPEDLDPAELAAFYVATAEFPAGFMTRYEPSMVTGDTAHQDLATGFPVGKRFRSAPVRRVADFYDEHLGHHHRADGRWRLYAFADAAAPGEPSALGAWAAWLLDSPESPVRRFTPLGADFDALFDVKVVYQQPHDQVDLAVVPPVFRPHVGPFGLVDYEKVYAADPELGDVFDLRGIDRTRGAVVVVRPDQYVAHVLPLTATAELATFFAGLLLPADRTAAEPVEA